MDTQVLGLLLFLSANFHTTSPTPLKEFKRLSNFELFALEYGLKNAESITGSNLTPHILQALCKRYALTSNFFNTKDVLLSKSHICLHVLDSSFVVKHNFDDEKRKLRRFRRQDILREPPIPSKTGKGKDLSKNATQNQFENLPEDKDFMQYPMAGLDPDGIRQAQERREPTGISEKAGDNGRVRQHIVPPLYDQMNIDGVSDNKGPHLEIPDHGDIEHPANDSSGTVANWVFITIGASAVLVSISVFLLSFLYRMRMAQPRQRVKEHCKELPPKADALLSLEPPQFKSDPSSNEVEFLPMLRHSRGLSEECDLSIYDEPSKLTTVVVGTEEKPERVRFSARCVSGSPRENTRRSRTESTGSIYKMVPNDGNKLRGGNGDFHRRYVDNPYVSDEIELQPYVKKSSRHPRKFEPLQLNFSERSSKVLNSDNGWNGSSASSSTSHHSARSYISIPPTSPSSNYIEAGCDNVSLLSTKSTSPAKMEWLTKSFSLDRKNQMASYQASTGVQTEDLVSPPTSKTVLGTSWQFGGAFAYRGGVLQARGSDVILSVPIGAVPRGQAIDIYGSVFTDTAQIRRKIEFPSEESLVTPVVEYLALPVNDFKRPLHLHLPHSLPAEFDINNVKVYTFSIDARGAVTIFCLPFHDRSNLDDHQDSFWEKSTEENKIIITTTHFSGYFCTLCESTSLPSICTMVFGSHVQISEHRREIRVILYIWDRRLTIRDYLERFQKQESEVDRQLLTDMQVPLLNNASSDSRLVMRMEIMGSEEERQCWRHVARPGGSRLLFKPLQVRRLSEIVQCCRHTDPVRVEWALENHPDVSPGPIFQCCIDILHTPESICDYEAALSEDLDDLMRTFYVRDLKVMSRQEDLESPALFTFERATLKRTLSEALDLKQTEQMCFELGIPSKDIGNFHKKFSSDTEVQCHLVEECLQRFGHEKFVSQLPIILDKLQLSHLLQGVAKENSKHSAPNPGPQSKSISATGKDVEGRDSSLTACKSINIHSKKSRNCDCNPRNMCSQHGDLPEKCDAMSGKSSLNNSGLKYSGAAAAPSRASLDRSDSHVGPQNSAFNHHVATNNKLDSSSGYASINQHGGSQSSPSVSLTYTNNLQSIDNFSMVAHVDTLQMPQSSVTLPQKPQVSQQYPFTSGEAYPEVTEELAVSTSGPKAFAGQRHGIPEDSNLQDNLEQTFKKELFGMHTVV